VEKVKLVQKMKEFQQFIDETWNNEDTRPIVEAIQAMWTIQNMIEEAEEASRNVPEGERLVEVLRKAKANIENALEVKPYNLLTEEEDEVLDELVENIWSQFNGMNDYDKLYDGDFYQDRIRAIDYIKDQFGPWRATQNAD